MVILNEDTIAAIATPYGTAGIGKIRISGSEALDVADKIFSSMRGKKLKDVQTYTAHYGYVVDPGKGNKIDEVIAIVMKNPHSFTGEDVVEFDCHGGMTPLKKVLELILSSGARLAEPGEFSKRAFLNGRIDLTQAEAIIEVINSKTDESLNIAVNHLTGKLSSKVNNIRDKVMELLAHLEASIDFPEDEIEGFHSSELEDRINVIVKEIENLLATSKQGRIYREGLKTVIVGKPNVGKSSLLNTLLDENRAIVTEVPGTTRDVIEEFINLEGIPLKIIDTAGIRETEDMVEKIGVEKTRNSLDKADLILLMLDVSQGLTREDLEVYNIIKGKPLIVVINKTDLSSQIDEGEVNKHFSEHPILWVSIKEEVGLDNLRETIVNEIFNKEIDVNNTVMVTSVRHINALEKSLTGMKRVEKSFEDGFPNDFLTIDLKDCLINLGEITGETLADDIIDRIFSEFCLGK